MQDINLNIIPKGIPDVVNVSQYDVGRVIKFTFTDGVTPYTIPEGATVEVGGRKKDNTIFDYAATVAGDRTYVTIATTEQMTAVAGDNLCQLRINLNGTVIATVNFTMRVQERPDVGNIESVSEIPVIISLAREQEANAEAWAKGTKGGVPVGSSEPQYNNNSYYWADVARQYAESFADGVKYKGTTLFANIPTSGMANGDMYDVTDAFVTDSRFSEGAGISVPAGTNIIWNDNISKWDLIARGGVDSFNGRQGAVVPAANDYTAAQIKYGDSSNVSTELGNKVDKHKTDGVDDRLMTAAEGTKLAGIQDNAEVNVQADWNEADSAADAYIKNKPSIPSGYTSTPAMDGVGSAGSSSDYAKGDHVHPTDTSRQPATLSSPILIGGTSQTTVEGALGGLNTVKTDLGVVAAPFDTTTTYAVGDYCTYQGKFYKFYNAHTGAWNASDVTETVVADNFGSGGGGPSPYASNPAMDGTASPGSANQYARGDHVHPSDTSKLGVNDSAASVAHSFEVYTGGGSSVSKIIDFSGAATRKIYFREQKIKIFANSWSSVVDSNGYYTYTKNDIDRLYYVLTPNVYLKGETENGLPTAAEQAAYALLDKVTVGEGETSSTVTQRLKLYAKTKPTSDFYILLQGMDFV